MSSGRKKRSRGEGMVGFIIVLAVVVLVSVTAATNLGESIVALIVGTEEANKRLHSAVDRPDLEPGSGNGNVDDPPIDDPPIINDPGKPKGKLAQ